jgi:type 1 glutamine amidotransferase
MRSILLAQGLFWPVLFTALPRACEAVDKLPAKKIVLVAGRKSHGPEGNGIHDYPWSVRLLKVLFESSNVCGGVRVETHFGGWPADDRSLEDADTLVLISDGRDGSIGQEAPHLATEERQNRMEKLIQNGCGLVTFHFSVFAPEAAEERVLRWSGGYFQWDRGGERKWYSAIRVAEDDLVLPSPDHPVVRGVRPFRMRDEFYYNLRFAGTAVRVSPLLAVPVLPGRDPDGRWVAWATEREGGGRAFGTSCGHFYDNWKNDGFRKLMLNAIAWTAKLEVPAGGVESNYVERDQITEALRHAKDGGCPEASPPGAQEAP